MKIVATTQKKTQYMKKECQKFMQTIDSVMFWTDSVQRATACLVEKSQPSRLDVKDSNVKKLLLYITLEILHRFPMVRMWWDWPAVVHYTRNTAYFVFFLYILIAFNSIHYSLQSLFITDFM